VKYKNFEQYTRQYSKDIESFINRVAIATNENIKFPYFDYIKNKFDLQENFKNIPIIVSSDFTNKSLPIYESSEFTYNLNEMPDIDQVFEDFKNETFTTNSVSDIKDIKKLKFPITAYHASGSTDFKTKGKLKASEGIYNKFREKIIPKTKFKVLSFKGEPISVVETINNFPLDVDMKRFTLLREVKKISKTIYEKYNLDFYNIELLESSKGKLYINSVNRKLDLNPHEAFVVYEAAYNDYYSSRMPNWVKDKMITESVASYYNQKYLDSQLVKSKHTFDYEKYSTPVSKINESSSIPDRYKKKGYTKVGVKKQNRGSGNHKWSVLARKKVGGKTKYKIVNGGYKGMDDYKSHKDPKRKKAFWDRMGGKNSAKAKDPFSALYWHKRFGTW